MDCTVAKAELLCAAFGSGWEHSGWNRLDTKTALDKIAKPHSSICYRKIIMQYHRITILNLMVHYGRSMTVIVQLESEMSKVY